MPAKTIGELIAQGEGPVEMLRPESAVCPRCGLKPKAYPITTKSGRELLFWIPVDHQCKGARRDH